MNLIMDPKTLKPAKGVDANDPIFRRKFEDFIRFFLKEDYPNQIIEGVEIFDGKVIECWYEYDNNQKGVRLN